MLGIGLTVWNRYKQAFPKLTDITYAAAKTWLSMSKLAEDLHTADIALIDTGAWVNAGKLDELSNHIINACSFVYNAKAEWGVSASMVLDSAVNLEDEYLPNVLGMLIIHNIINSRLGVGCNLRSDELDKVVEIVDDFITKQKGV